MKSWKKMKVISQEDWARGLNNFIERQGQRV